MRKLHRQVPVALALIFAVLLASCFRVTRVITRKKNSAGKPQQLMVATRDELNDRIARIYNAINSFQATVDMTPSLGSVYQGQITEYKDVRAFVLFRKPAEIRIIGQLPVVRTKAFDMVSTGHDFRFYLVAKNLFVEGANDAPATSKNKIENLRPEAFLSSMLIRPADPATEIAMLEDATDEDNALYILHYVKKLPGGGLMLFRSVWFDRIDLSIVRQKELDPEGVIVSDTRYSKWQPYSGTLFPAHIDINRWKDGYGVVMDVVQMQMNKALTNDQFVLAQPEGAKLQMIGSTRQENH
jgi:hypothetical protein